MYHVLIVFLALFTSTKSLEFKYHNHSEIADVLREYEDTAKDFNATLYSIGKSVQGRDLWVMEVSGADLRAQGVPNVKLIANMHGNEAVGREVLLQFLMYLKDNFNNNSEITWLIKNTRIHVMPTMNPDGFAKSMVGCDGDTGRLSARFKDLNRNFPDYFHFNPARPEDPEVTAIRDWMKTIPFVLSASIHGGALVANYPFDTVKERKWEKFLKQLREAWNNSEEANRLREEYLLDSYLDQLPSLTPDDDVFKHLAIVYAQNHPTMHKGTECRDTSFPGGIVNGAAWYSFDGGMSDYNYAFHGCYELTLEISCCKFPHASWLPRLWEENKKALLEFVKEAHKGVTGVVLDEETHLPILHTVLKIKGRNIDFYPSQRGEFWRLLLPGRYTLIARAEGYHTTEVDFDVIAYQDLPKLTSLKVFMVNMTKSPPTTSTTATTTTVVTTAKITTLRSTIKPEVIMQGKITTLDKPIYSKQTSSKINEVSGAYTFYASPDKGKTVIISGNQKRRRRIPRFSDV